MGKIKLPIKVLIIGIIIGVIFAGIGLFKQIDSKRINEERKQAALKRSQERIDTANKRLEEIAVEYDEAKAKLEAKAKECDAIVTGSNGWFEKKNACIREKQELQSDVWDLEAEDSKIRNASYTEYYQPVKPMSYIVFYIIGGSVAGAGALAAFIIYLVKGKKTYN